MSFTEAVKVCWSKYSSVEGRARRSEYWYFWLLIVLVGIGGLIAFTVVAMAVSDFSVTEAEPRLWGLVVLVSILPVLLPGLSVVTRRLHDTGRSGWWGALGLLPFVGGLIMLVLTVQDSGPDNAYGVSPKSTGKPVFTDY